jgi:hypothetical protein
MNTTHLGNVTFVQFPRRAGAFGESQPYDAEHARIKSRARREEAAALRNDEESLVERLALGDLDAAVEIKERYEHDLRRTARVILEDEREVRCVVDAALDEACSGWPPQRGRVERWLRALVRRIAHDRRRVLGFNA